MEAVGSGPFRVGSLVWQSRPGVFVFSVVCKVTFDLLPGESRLAETPSNIVPFDVRAANDETKSLSAASDLVPFKVRPEVILTGHAYAPGGRAAAQLVARFAVPGAAKAISVHGDRGFSRDGELEESAPFVKMPLVWERAAGGPATSNPAGIVTGSEARADTSGRVLLPNLVPLGSFFPARSEVIAPVGFGPIAPSWPGRRACLRGHAATWDVLRWSERPLPADIDGAYFQAAPADQSVTEISPDERIFLENLHPEIPQLMTRLPRVVPRAVAELGDSSSPLSLRCDTLVIDTDKAVATLVYRGNLPVDHPHRAGRVVVTEDLPAPRAAVLTQIGVAPSTPALPFEPGSSEVASMLAALPPQMRAKMAARLASLGDLSGISVSGTTLPVAGSMPVLPFAGSARDSAGRDAAARDDAGRDAAAREAALRDAAERDAAEEAETQPPPRSEVPAAPVAAVTPLRPFVVPAAWAAGTFSVTETQAFPADPPPAELAIETPALRAEVPGAPVIETPAFRAEPPREPVIESPGFRDAAASAAPREEPAPAPAIAPTPPPMVGPLAGRQMNGGGPAAPGDASAGGGSAAAPAPDQMPTPEDYPMARYAGIEASLDLREADRAQILETHGLSEAGFEHLRRHWIAQVDAEAARGRSLLMRAYDAAYIGQIEAERGPLTVPEYAKLSLAIEAGTAPDALAQMGLPARSAMPISRAWIAKMARDPKLGARVRRAIDEERGR